MNYNIGIHSETNRKPSPFADKYARILSFNNIPYTILDINEPGFWDEVEKLSHFIFRWEHYEDEKQLARTILPVIENEYGIKCFPDQRTSWHYDDKIRQYFMLEKYKFPFTSCYIFWDREAAHKWVREAEIPLVVKLRGGAGSKNVQLLRTRKKTKKVINKMFGTGRYPSSIDRNTFSLKREVFHMGGKILRFLKGMSPHDTWVREKNYVLFQKFLPGNKYDTRVTVIGKRAFGFRRGVRPNDFRASGSGNIDYDMDGIDKRCLSIAFDVSSKMKFQTMAYDFIYNENKEPEFCEISYTFVDEAVFACPGYWDDKLNWHEGQYWPQYFQLMDLLEFPELKQPEIEV